VQSLSKAYTSRLNSWIFIGIIAGLVFGLLAPEWALASKPLGDLFLRLLSLLVIPVVILSVLVGIINLNGAKQLGSTGLKALLYYTLTTGLAVATGLILVNLVGVHFFEASATLSSGPEAKLEVAGGGLGQVLNQLIPRNIFQAANDGNILGLIFFSVFFGIALLHVPSLNQSGLKSTLQTMLDAILWMVERVLLIAPPCLAALIASVTASLPASIGSSLLAYVLIVIAGLLFHALVTLPAIGLIFKVNLFKLARAVFPAISTAFATASSSATLPLTLDRMEKHYGAKKEICGFVLPLGSTVNMDGTAIYEAIAAVFIAHVYGIELTFAQQIIIFLTATFSAVGAAGIPGAGLIMMTLVLESVGLPIEGISLIVGFDRALDMLRTSINVWGDCIGTAILDKSTSQE